MKENEKEKDETSALVDQESSSGGTENESGNESNEGNEDNEGNENNEDFDPTAFSQLEEDDEPGNESGNESNESGNSSDDDDDDDDQNDNDTIFSFDNDDNDDQSGNESNESGNESDESDESSNNETQTQLSEEASNNVLKAFESKGIKAKSVDEILDLVDQLQKDNLAYKTKYVSNDRIEFYKKTLSLEDRALVEAEYSARYKLEGDKLKTAIDKLESSGQLEIEAIKIRGDLNNAINREVNLEQQREKDSIAKREQNRKESREALKKHLDETETMFGFNMAKNKSELPKVREKVYSYIDSGKLMHDVLASPESLVKIAWFLMQEENITKALINKGKQTEKENFLSDIGNHTTTDNTGSHGSSNDDDNKEFDPKKFSAIEE